MDRSLVTKSQWISEDLFTKYMGKGIGNEAFFLHSIITDATKYQVAFW